MDCEKPEYVNFAARITFFYDFQDMQGRKFRHLVNISCLGICCLLTRHRFVVFHMLGVLFREFCSLIIFDMSCLGIFVLQDFLYVCFRDFSSGFFNMLF